MRLPRRALFALVVCLSGVLALAVFAAGSMNWTASAAEEVCCKEGETTPPTKLMAKFPKGELHNPYKDIAKVAEEGHKQFLRPGCNECHGGTGGGGICPPLTQGVWFWGNSDDVLFRLITLGSADLEKQGYKRLGYGSVHAPMPPMGMTIKISDDLWKIIAWIRSINPPGTNPPDKILPQE
jgi:mono/diheme cytochrome c family protein